MKGVHDKMLSSYLDGFVWWECEVGFHSIAEFVQRYLSHTQCRYTMVHCLVNMVFVSLYLSVSCLHNKSIYLYLSPSFTLFTISVYHHLLYYV